MSAALPGAIAAKTNFRIPVIGVPLVASDGISNGMDALMSMIRLPPGVPVMVVGMGKTGLKNSALAAAQIIASTDNPAGVYEKLSTYISEKKKRPQINVVRSPEPPKD